MPLVIKSAAKKKILGGKIMKMKSFSSFVGGIGAMFREKFKCQICDKFTLQALHDTVCIG